VTEVDKLWDRLQEQGVVNMHVTLAEGFSGTAEDVARELNCVDAHLSDPRNNLLARMGGAVFMLRDSLRPQVDFKTGERVALDAKQHHQRRRNAEMLELLEEAMAMIEADGGQ
jgi:hypothetical protein